MNILEEINTNVKAILNPKKEIIEMDIAKKSLRSSFGDVDLDIPRDRKAEFEPQIIKKYETVCNELDKNLIGKYISIQRLEQYSLQMNL